MGQDRIFKESEGDNYFTRNKKALNLKKMKNDPVLKIIRLFNLFPKRVLELGCANGFRLNHLRHKYHCECFGIDCSKLAIKDGQNKYKKIKLACSGIDSLPFRNRTFDLVIINFVLHWIDRGILRSVISETDRILKNKGLLIVGDFYPPYPIRTKYHHLRDGLVYTYKEDYSRRFERLGYYQNIGRLSAECGSRKIGADIEYGKRIKTDLLKKDFLLKKCKPSPRG